MRRRTRTEPIPDYKDLPKIEYRQLGRDLLYLVKLPIEYCRSVVDEASTAFGYSQHNDSPAPEKTDNLKQE